MLSGAEDFAAVKIQSDQVSTLGQNHISGEETREDKCRGVYWSTAIAVAMVKACL